MVIERLLDTSCMPSDLLRSLFLVLDSTSHSPQALAWGSVFAFRRITVSTVLQGQLRRQTVKTVRVAWLEVTPRLKPGENEKANQRTKYKDQTAGDKVLSTPQILHIQLHSNFIIPHICFDRVGEFDASFNLRRLPIAVDTIEPNRLQRPILLPRESQL